MGNEGTIEVLNRQILNYYPEKFGNKTPGESGRAQGVCTVELPGNDNKAVEAHMKNWVEAMQGKAKVIAGRRGRPASGDFQATWRTLSLRNNKKVIWDDKARK